MTFLNEAKKLADGYYYHAALLVFIKGVYYLVSVLERPEKGGLAYNQGYIFRVLKKELALNGDYYYSGKGVDCNSEIHTPNAFKLIFSYTSKSKPNVKLPYKEKFVKLRCDKCLFGYMPCFKDGKPILSPKDIIYPFH